MSDEPEARSTSDAQAASGESALTPLAPAAPGGGDLGGHDQRCPPAQAVPRLDPADVPRLDRASFPHQPPPGGQQLPCTIANVRHLLDAYGVRVAYDVIKKKIRISVPGQAGSADNRDNVALSHVMSLAALNGIPLGQVPDFVQVIADDNLVNPAAEWITSKPWDGVDRLQAFYDTLAEQDGYPRPLKKELLYRWLLSLVAAALRPRGFRARGVLTLQGEQSIGKTAWVLSLVPDELLREQLVKIDHHLDPNNKDSVLTAVSHLIVEIGELDSSFRKDVARLKGFLTADCDKLRRPYARIDSEYQRRTVFVATVNDPAFLVDQTGNTRFWVIPVKAINYEHGIDMQQLLAQVKADFDRGEKWWLDPPVERCLEECNLAHRAISAVRERVLEAIDLDRVREAGLPAMTASEVLIRIGISNPTNTQSKEAAATLREILGPSKRIGGYDTYRVPLRERELLPLRP